MEDMYILHQLPGEEPTNEPEHKHPIMDEVLPADDLEDNDFFEDIAEFNAFQNTPITQEPEDDLILEVPITEEMECNLWPELFCADWEMELAEAYVRAQPLEDIYAPEEGLMMGTAFPNLLRPYDGRP